MNISLISTTSEVRAGVRAAALRNRCRFTLDVTLLVVYLQWDNQIYVSAWAMEHFEESCDVGEQQ